MAAKNKAKKAGGKKHPRLADRIAKRLKEIDGVAGVTLGGSWALGVADDESDIDLGVYYRSEAKPSIQSLRELARELDDRGAPDAATDFGDWGPWVNGGAWLLVDGVRVDWIYRELGRVVQTITDSRAGRVTIDYQAGHPHGISSHLYMAEIALGIPLVDTKGVLAAMKKLAAEYPRALADAVIEKNLWEAEFTLERAAKQPKRGDVAHVAGSLYRCAAALVQVLYAANGKWFLGEKGSVAAAGGFDRSPAGFTKRLEVAVGAEGTSPRQLATSMERMRRLVAETRALVT